MTAMVALAIILEKLMILLMPACKHTASASCTNHYLGEGGLSLSLSLAWQVLPCCILRVAKLRWPDSFFQSRVLCFSSSRSWWKRKSLFAEWKTLSLDSPANPGKYEDDLDKISKYQWDERESIDEGTCHLAWLEDTRPLSDLAQASKSWMVLSSSSSPWVQPSTSSWISSKRCIFNFWFPTLLSLSPSGDLPPHGSQEDLSGQSLMWHPELGLLHYLYPSHWSTSVISTDSP